MNTKKIAALLMALILAMTMLLAGCGDDKKKDDDDKKEETPVAATEKTTEAVKDKVEDDSLKPSTKGFTLKELEKAIDEYLMNQYDVEFLNQYTLAESNAILEYMLANDASVGNAEFEEVENGTSITEMFGYGDLTVSEDASATGVDFMFANDGNWYIDEYDELDWSDEGDIEGEQLENGLDYYVEKYSEGYYDVTADAVANAYKGSGEKVEFVDLSFVIHRYIYSCQFHHHNYKSGK